MQLLLVMGEVAEFEPEHHSTGDSGYEAEEGEEEEEDELDDEDDTDEDMRCLGYCC